MSWTGLKELNELAKRICDDFAVNYPPAIQEEKKPHARKQLVVALLSVEQNIGRFLESNPAPGVFKRAKCANEVKWGLKDKGFNAQLVDAVINKVVFGLSRTAAKGKKEKSGR